MRINQEMLLKKAHDFLKSTFEELELQKVVIEPHWHIDHLCYRTSSEQVYQQAKDSFSAFATLLIESKVNGRMISTFKLPDPIVFQDWEIDLIEVPAPKVGKSVEDGFEHLEIVCDQTFSDLKEKFKDHKIDVSGLKKNFNQEFEVNFDGFAIKFHHLSLESVINIESQTQVYRALMNSNVLEDLKSYNPLVAGTFPLALNTPESDLDILISGENLEALKKDLVLRYQHMQKFKCQVLTLDQQDTLVINFIYEGIPFEIFGQKTPAIKQKAYQHFLAEERVLKIAGISFKEKIKKARTQGFKTEPAFAKVLNLKGDAYLEVLKLQKLSNPELKAILKEEK